MAALRATTYIWLVLASCLAFAQTNLDVIQLRHTTAEQVLPALRPLLEPGGVLTGQRTQLIVRTSPHNLEELRRALQALDVPRRRLTVSVRFDVDDEDVRAAARFEARATDRGSRIDVQARQARGLSEGRVDQRIHVLEGGRAFIADGRSEPLQLRDGLMIRNVVTGFEVVPRLAGGSVILEIAPQRQEPGALPGSARSLGGATTLRTRLGEWIELAGVDTARVREDHAMASNARQREARSRRIWVRVDEVRP